MFRDKKTPKYRKLYLDKQNAKISGVCAGVGDYFGLDPMVVRIVTVLIALFGGGLIILGYILLTIFLDAKPKDMFESKKESEFWKSVRTEPSNTVRDVRYKFRDIERRLRAAEAHVTSPQYNLHREINDLDR
ncbi:envelope stress response membrane protein PspC [Emcibacteraceae bacterium]|jgi:phage shock protein C|uniref:envelope stress response membrane protein PspC n=1 Tax=Pseudemcibacter sp. TaxID=2943293 RepID=UPI002315F528|nr:envelope stress response membrane protein PspC [Kordiimonadaceae bacterium]MDA7568145.1 envelope stress response membrane protein PspC [Emcibacteraceae bacterium]MDA9180513.1 envelope stress response membrane protein PspC [Emcibacteraceae bacterium]MDA9769703.1 envelope stress response membrane protein PspC [Emcibacteraceae bacterium]MDC1089857.1 envelope stress response membrane protein PspC [Emcibacteraceae bacterium]